MKKRCSAIRYKVFFGALMYSTLSVVFFYVLANEVHATLALGSNDGFYTIAELEAHLDDVRTTHPTLITSKVSIGTSHNGNDIWMIKVSDNADTDEDEIEIFYNSLIHGDETGGYTATLYFLNYLLDNYGTDPTVTHLVNNRELYFVPMINPDGYVAGTRKNARPGGGVDLNRNFGPESYWDYPDGGSSTSPSAQNYRGPSVFSEPESQAIRDFITDREFVSAFNYHTCGELFIYPYAHNGGLTSDQSTYAAWGKSLFDMSGYFPGNTLNTALYQTRGTMTDYMYDGDATIDNILAIEPEFTDCATYGYGIPEDEIISLSATMLDPNLFLALSADVLVNTKEYSFGQSEFLAGQTGTLDVTFRNVGLNASGTTTATLTTSSPHITISDGTETLSSLDHLSTTTVTDAFRFTVNTGVADHTPITVTVKTFQGSVEMSSRDISFYTGTGNRPSTGFYERQKEYGIDQLNHTISHTWADISQDGFDDLIRSDKTSGISVYLNGGLNESFTDASSIYDMDSYGTPYQVDAIDVNGDQLPDIYITSYEGDNKLYINNGPNEAMTDATSTYGLQGTVNDSTSSWFDIDSDGDLDLYLTIWGYNNRLYLNNGPNEAFTDATSTYDLGAGTYNTASTDWGDIDNDGYTDLLITNTRWADSSDMQIFINNGPGQPFTDATSTYGIETGIRQIDADFVDIDHDKDLDIYITSDDANNILLQNNGPNQAFTDVTSTYNLDISETNQNSSSKWFDADNDGDLDVYIDSTYGEKVMYRNNGPGQAFTNVTSEYDLTGTEYDESYSQSVLDFDEDGDLDIFTSYFSGPDRLLLNGITSGRSYIRVETQDLALGTRFEIDLDGNGDFDTSGEVRTLIAGDSAGYTTGGIFSTYEHIGLDTVIECTTDIRVYLSGVALDGEPSYELLDACPNKTYTFPYTTEALARSFVTTAQETEEKGIRDGEVTDRNNIYFSWHQSAEVAHYKVYTRAQGSDTWDETQLGSDDDSYEKYFEEGDYEWKVRAVHTDGEVTDTDVFTFTVDNSVDSNITVHSVNGEVPASGHVYVAPATLFHVKGSAEAGSEVVVSIQDIMGDTLFQEILCTADETGLYVCEAPALINTNYRIGVSAADRAGNSVEPLMLQLIIGGPVVSASNQNHVLGSTQQSESTAIKTEFSTEDGTRQLAFSATSGNPVTMLEEDPVATEKHLSFFSRAYSFLKRVYLGFIN